MKLRALVLLSAVSLHASVIGTSRPAPSLTAERIRAVLPPAQRAAWLAYLHRSSEQMAADKRALAAERAGLTALPPLPKQSFSAHSIPMDKDAAFYASAEARHIGDVIVSFQTPAGGWSKNLDMTGSPRAKGQSFTTGNRAPVASPGEDFDKPADENWHYVGTLDNDATNTELHFLARLAAAMPGKDGGAYRESFERGVRYLLNAQFPNGGWPQVWPLEGGYHDAITFNDDAVTESAELLLDVAHGGSTIALSEAERDALASGEMLTCGACQTHPGEDFSFVNPALRKQAAAAADQAIALILRAQIAVDETGRSIPTLTLWPQQADPLTLAPVAARNFEPAALSSTESASILLFLMHLPHPSPEVVGSVHAGVAWFAAHSIAGYTWSGGRNTPGGRKLTASAGAGPLWARYYSLTTGQPIFGDRDRTIHDDVMELSLERRNGYGWYGDAPARALAAFSKWSKQFPLPANGAHAQGKRPASKR